MKNAPEHYRAEDMLCLFESRWDSSALHSLKDYLPPAAHPDFVEVMTELIRVDMEFSYAAGQPRDARTYFAQYPEMTAHEEAKSAIVFEEYRLTNIHTEPIAAEALSQKYHVDATTWPDIQFASARSASTRPSAPKPSLFDRKRLPIVGETYLGFKIIGKLGEGAFGLVLLAQQSDLAGRLTVLKFSPLVSEEHRFLARLQHTNIVPVFSIHGGGHFRAICMPFLGVATLQDLIGHLGSQTDSQHRISIESQALVHTTNRLKEKTVENTIPNPGDLNNFKNRSRLESHGSATYSLPHLPLFAAQMMAEIADGLGYAHDRGIVHGDMKPANVLIDDDGHPIILDFHLATSKLEGLGKHVGGTLAYMAPEQLAVIGDNVSCDARADVYSAGVILFELITGRLPYDVSVGKNGIEALQDARQQPIQILSNDQKLLGADLTSIVAKCLRIDPNQRYQTGYQLADDLKCHLNHQRLLHAPDQQWGNRMTKWARRNPRLSSIWSVTCLASILVAILAFALWSAQHNVAVAHATNASRAIIEESASARSPLTAYMLDDSKHFEDAISNAQVFIGEANWETTNDFYSASRTRLLSGDQKREELKAATELHFWIAEARQRLADNMKNSNKLRQTCLEHALQENQTAVSFSAEAFGLVGLRLQRNKIEASLRGENYTVRPPWDKLDHLDRLDRAMVTLLGRNDHEHVLVELRRLLEEDSRDFLAWLQTGQTYYAVAKYEAAQACFTVCIGLEPKNSYPRLYRAMTVLKARQGGVASAIEDLQIANELSPNHLAIVSNLALANVLMRDFETAKRYYDQAIAMGPEQTRTWYLRSRVQRMLGNLEEAKKDMDYFMSTEPSDPISWRTRGTQKIADAPLEAIEDFKRGLALYPGDHRALNNLAHVYSEKLHDLPQAIEAMDLVVKLQPKSATYLAGASW